jgi:dihydroflavonol-4-reductase
MKCFVTGGTGFLGAHVVRQLVARGDQVTVMVRPTSSRRLIEGLPIKGTVGDISDASSLDGALKDIDQLYHVAADYRLWARDPAEIYRGNVDGTRNVLESARAQGVRRVVYTSTVGCLGLPRDGSPGDETTPVTRDELIGNYKKSKYDAERVAEDYSQAGLDVVIVNPSTPVGPGDIKPTPTGRMVLDFLRGKMPAYVDTGLNLIAVEDAAAGHLLAADSGRSGEKYILGNRNMMLKDILAVLARITGRKPPTLRLPHWVPIAAAAVDDTWARVTGNEPGIALEAALMSRKRMFFSADKAVRELGVPQSPVDEALARAVEWFQSNGYVN